MKEVVIVNKSTLIAIYSHEHKSRFVSYMSTTKYKKKTQSFVINIAISAYPTMSGGATTQYDQKIVRLISFSKASLDTACVICKTSSVTKND
jgi:hypothetical protein